LIALFVGVMVWDANLVEPEPADATASTQPDKASGASPVDPAGEMMGRLLVGVKSGLSPETVASTSELLLSQAETLREGPPRDQLSYAVLVAEFEGSKVGLERLEILESKFDEPAEESGDVWDENAKLVHKDLRLIFEANQRGLPSALSPEALKRLEKELGWFGKLAPLTDGTADASGRDALMSSMKNVPWALGGVAIWYLICGLAGAVFLVLLVVFAVTGQLKHGMASASPCSSVYAESFAVWLGCFVAMRYAVVQQLPESMAHLGIAINMAGLFFATGLALTWCVIRGIPWSRVRVDLGLSLGPQPIREIGSGLMVYATALPLLLVGGLMTVALTALRDRLAPGSPMPSHPVQGALMGADWSTIIQIMVLGVIVAPLVEETMFRGALYRQLRDSTRWLGFVGSALLSAVVSSVIFAAIHPQGWVFIPALASLAMAFCIAREWRGNLPAGIVAHGLTNFITLSLNVLLFSQ